MTPEEIEVIREFHVANDTKILTAFARKAVPSVDFFDFILGVLDSSTINKKGKPKDRDYRTLITVMALCDLPKNEKSDPKSVFSIVGREVEIPPSTLYTWYYKLIAEPETLKIIDAYKEYKSDPSKALPIYRPMMLEIEGMIQAVNSYTPRE